MDILKPVIDVVTLVGTTFEKYVKYQFCPTEYVHEFERMQKDLENRLKDIEAELETQCNQPGKIARNEVNAWREKARRETAIKVEDLICKGGCFTYICSSRKLDKKKVLNEGIYTQGEKYTIAGVSLVIHDHSIKGVPLPVEECSDRNETQQILQWLKGDQVARIAVCGMGGVGKTTIMKQVHNELLQESKFDKVIWVKVSKDFDIIVQQKMEFDVLKFQKIIARRLELKFTPEDENETQLAGLISQRLGQGSFLLILDDVWESLSLEEVGIPNLVGNNGCKLVLTTRLLRIAREMDCKVIPVNPLPHDEALALFLEKVGNDVLSNGRIKREMEPFFKQILQKCGGVPLAVVTIAKTMRGRLDLRSWKWALSKLSTFEGIVNHLKFSYECLESQCQECFLYCALYPENYEIPKEELIEYWIEEGFIYKEGQTRDAMNCEGHVILEKLVDNCLLELVKGDDDKEDCVSMHDLLRQMGLDIRPEFLMKAGRGLEKLPEDNEWREDLLKVSLMRNYIREIPLSTPSPRCPVLTTLLLSNNKISTIPEAFFEHMLGLKILDLSNNRKLGRLPSSVSKLNELTTLLLGGCESLREVPSLSNLGGLKKLDLLGTSIEKLPQGLNMLTNMKYLNLDGRLSEIPNALLQNLSKLQHLRVTARIALKAEDIGRLRKLEFLRGRFSRVHDMSIIFNSGGTFLNMYAVFVGSHRDYLDILSVVKLKSIVCYDIDICGEPNWLPSDVQRLKIGSCKDVRSLNDIPGFQDAINLRVVDIASCHNVEFVFSLSWLSRCNLEQLCLSDLNNLNAVFREVGAVAKSIVLPAGTFSSLKGISVHRCNKIKKLFLVRWLWCFQNLETIKVNDCKQMDEIIWFEYEGEKVTLPKLESLILRALPQLKCIYSGSNTVLVCDSIKKIEIKSCPEIESVFKSGFNPLPTLDDIDLQGLLNLKLVFDEEALGLSPPLPPRVFFPLRRIWVSECHQLKKVFSSGWLLGYFQFLETIEVRCCLQMEEIISSSAYEEQKVTLPKLESLILRDLPQLKCIYKGSSTVLICDSIKKIEIGSCPEIESVFKLGFNPLPTLKDIDLQALLNLKLVFDEEALGLSPPLSPRVFFPLRRIWVSECHQLKKVFSSGWLLGYFQFLETIEVRCCLQMEEIISSSAYEEQKVTLPNLESLVLRDLPQLKSIYKGSSTVLICNSVKKIEIRSCPEIESVFRLGFNPLPTLQDLDLQGLVNLKSVFDEEALGLLPPLPPTIFFSLKTIKILECDQLKKVLSSGWLLGYFQFLETVKVEDCKEMEELISSSAYVEEKVILPNLQGLELTNLPQLKSIYSNSRTVLICDSIKTIEIQFCPKIECVFWSRFNPLSTLEYLNLEGLENLKSMFDEEGLGLSPLVPPTSFFSLKEIRVFGCHQLKKVFSSGWLLNYFQYLKTIEVGGCSQMEELISSSAHEEEKVTLPKLLSLELFDLPALKSICNCSSVLICDSIQSLRISNCKKLKRIPLNFPLLDDAQPFHSPSLKEIVVFPKEWWESLEWDHPNAKGILLRFCKFPKSYWLC